jgi:Zn-dependent peptidase ImmA (M78 family)
VETFQQFHEKKRAKNNFEKLYKAFLDFVKKELDMDELPEIKLVDSKEEAKNNKSFGSYNGAVVIVNTAGRHPGDIFRTLAHELIHHKQNGEGRIHSDSGETGSDIENEANAKAGIVLRKFNKAYPAVFESVQKNKLDLV